MPLHPDEADPALDHPALVATDSAGLADAAAGNLDADVEFCPGWTVADLVRHVHKVHAFWGQIVDGRLTDYGDAASVPEPPLETLLDDFRAGADRFVAILRAADPATPVWTWAARKDVGFVIRHQVQEAAVHRWDAEHAAGRDFEIDRFGAADSVEEFLTVSLSSRDDLAASRDDLAASRSLAAPVSLVAVDVEAAWTVFRDADGAAIAHRGISDGGTQIRARASDLLLWLYGRRPTSALTVNGDPELAERLRARTATD